MSDTIGIVLIIAVSILIVLYLFRRQLSGFLLRANKDGIEAELRTRESNPHNSEQPSVNIRGNRQFGKGNTIEVSQSSVAVEENSQSGSNQKISVTPNQSTNKE